MDRLVAGDLTIDLVDVVDGVDGVDGVDVAGGVGIGGVVASPPSLRLDWHGKSNDRQPRQKLAPFFAHILERAAPRRLLVEMRFHRLEHFNSSTISSVIDFIHDARAQGVPLVIGYDAKITWQKIAFEALRVFTTGDGLLELRPS